MSQPQSVMGLPLELVTLVGPDGGRYSGWASGRALPAAGPGLSAVGRGCTCADGPRTVSHELGCPSYAGFDRRMIGYSAW